MRRVSLVVASLAAAAAVAQVPSKVGYQGRLLKSDGSPEAGIVDMTFSIYDVATGGVALGCDKAQVAVADGFYSVFLGDVGGCPGGGTAIEIGRAHV